VQTQFKHLKSEILNSIRKYIVRNPTPTQIVEDLESVGLVVDGFQLTEMGIGKIYRILDLLHNDSEYWKDTGI